MKCTLGSALHKDKLNDVVLTPSYVATFLVKLARVDKEQPCIEFCNRKCGALVAAMNG